MATSNIGITPKGEQMSSVLIVIPTYNESESIRSLLDRLDKVRVLLANKYAIDILIVDDNSPDKTADIIRSLNLTNLSILSRSDRKNQVLDLPT